MTALTFLFLFAVLAFASTLRIEKKPEDLMSRFGLRVIMLVVAASISFPAFTQEAGVSSSRIEIAPSLLSGGEAAKGRISIQRDPRFPAEAVTLRLGSSNNSLIRFPVELITIPVNQESAQFELGTAATPIRTTVSVQAYLGPSFRTSVSTQIELVPALLKSVRLSSPSMIGTMGNTINVTAELKAPAPAGGIELYLSPFKLVPATVGIKAADVAAVTHRVQAGMRSVTFPIRYNDVIATFSSLNWNASKDFSVSLETQTRRYELIVALDPSPNKVWSPIPSRAIAVYFDLIPLVVSSITVQPASLPDTDEALATFVLNAPPGAGERVYLGTTGLGSRVGLLGSSCTAIASSGTAGSTVESVPGDLELSAGVTSYQFKVCGKTVTSPTTDQIGVHMRSGSFRTPVTIQP